MCLHKEGWRLNTHCDGTGFCSCTAFCFKVDQVKMEELVEAPEFFGIFAVFLEFLKCDLGSSVITFCKSYTKVV